MSYYLRVTGSWIKIYDTYCLLITPVPPNHKCVTKLQVYAWAVKPRYLGCASVYHNNIMGNNRYMQEQSSHATWQEMEKVTNKVHKWMAPVNFKLLEMEMHNCAMTCNFHEYVLWGFFTLVSNNRYMQGPSHATWQEMKSSQLWKASVNFKLLEMTMHSCVIVRDFHVHDLREPWDALLYNLHIL